MADGFDLFGGDGAALFAPNASLSQVMRDSTYGGTQPPIGIASNATGGGFGVTAPPTTSLSQTSLLGTLGTGRSATANFGQPTTREELLAMMANVVDGVAQPRRATGDGAMCDGCDYLASLEGQDAPGPAARLSLRSPLPSNEV